MKKFSGGTAVITGAAHGIGMACAQEAVRRGMNVVAFDIVEDKLEQVASDLRADGGNVLAVVGDVSDPAAIKDLAAKAKETFGNVNLLISNAGVFVSGVAWDTPIELFEWVVDTNLVSVMAGINAFVPDMIASGEECHVVNVASIAAQLTPPAFCAYSSTKHGVMALTEALYFDLAAHEITNVGATCFMPGYVQTDVMNPGKAAPAGPVAEALARRLDSPLCAATEKAMGEAIDVSLPAPEAADIIFAAVEEGQLYSLPNTEGQQQYVPLLTESRITGKNPPNPAV